MKIIKATDVDGNAGKKKASLFLKMERLMGYPSSIKLINTELKQYGTGLYENSVYITDTFLPTIHDKKLLDKIKEAGWQVKERDYEVSFFK
jgi:hypothetical protein